MKILCVIATLATAVSAASDCLNCPNCLDTCLRLTTKDEMMLYSLISKIRGAKIANDVESEDYILKKPIHSFTGIQLFFIFSKQIPVSQKFPFIKYLEWDVLNAK